MAVNRSILAVAGEFAVAAELCRRDIYAQLTLGHQKRTDLLVFSEAQHAYYRIEVKTKQARDWPQCRGIWAQDSFLVFVDFAGKKDTERPDFYILTAQEWRAFVKAAKKDYKAKHPDRRVEITKENVIVLPDEVNKYGQPYRGCGVRPENIQGHREAWHKITKVAQEKV